MCSRVFGTRSMRCVRVVVAWAQKTVKRWRFRDMVRGAVVPRAHAGLAESPCVREARPWRTCFGCVCSPIVRQPIPRGGVFHTQGCGRGSVEGRRSGGDGSRAVAARRGAETAPGARCDRSTRAEGALQQIMMMLSWSNGRR